MPAMAGKSGAAATAGATGGDGHAGGAAGAAGDDGSNNPNGEDSGAGGAAPESAGCIDGTGHALSGTTKAACGAHGDACVACVGEQVCKAGSWVGSTCAACAEGLRCDEKSRTCVCDATSCADGCCSSDGECLSETTAHCGHAGSSCESCSAGQRCDAGAGACVCDATSCPKGCCDGDGRCVGYASESGTQCGAAGGTCAACSAGQACDQNGTCTCTPDSCDGWCHGDTCEPFETIATGQMTFPATRGIALRDSDIYWSASSGDSNAAKYWIQRRLAGAGVETLLSNQAALMSPLFFGAERLFIHDQDGFLRSMKPDGTTLTLDQTEVSTFRYRSGRVYWPALMTFRFRELHVESRDEADTMDVVDEPFKVVDSNAEVADIAMAGAQVAFALNNPPVTDGDLAEYEIWTTANASTPVFPSRAGRIEELDCDPEANYYWRVTKSVSSGAALLMQSDGASSATAIATDVDVTDFAMFQRSAGNVVVYYAYSDADTQTSGLRLYDTASSKTYDVVTGPRVGSLTADETYLYFFEATGHRLVRTPLPHAVFGLGK